jgi:hypothetical protein
MRLRAVATNSVKTPHKESNFVYSNTYFLADIGNNEWYLIYKS